MKKRAVAMLLSACAMLTVAGNGIEAKAVSASMDYMESYFVEATTEATSIAEIVKFNPNNDCIYIVDGENGKVDIVKIGADASTTFVKSIIAKDNLGSEFAYGDITSVDVNKSMNLVAISVQENDYAENGLVMFYDYDGNYLSSVEVGVQPDMVCFTPDGKYVLTANEGEPRNGYGEGSADPEGTISMIDLSADTFSATTIGFGHLDRDTALANGVLLKAGATLAQDVEPEYIAVSEDSKTAYITLQENNAIATLDLESKTITDIQGLGFKDHSVEGNELDLNKNDKQALIQNEDVYGVYMPDGLATINIGGVQYVLTPNEGDSREWEGLDGIEYINEAESEAEGLNDDGELEALEYKMVATEAGLNSKETKYTYDTEGLDDDKTYVFGARSFSIFRADDMSLVYDSGSDFEKITAELYPDFFNSDNEEDKIDNRSDNKGPEPEDVKVLTIGDRIYAFIALERISGIMMYDITDPANAFYVDYYSNRTFTIPENADEDGDNIISTSNYQNFGDLAPEGICTVTAEDSPTGKSLVLVANEVSGTVSVIEINVPVDTGTTDTGSTDTGSTSSDSGSSDYVKPEVNWITAASDITTALASGEAQNVELLAGDTMVVPNDILAQIAGTQVVLALQTGNDLAFSVSGQNITSEMAGSDELLGMKVFFDTSYIPMDIKELVTASAAMTRELTIEKTGATVVGMHYALGAEHAGKTAKLYYHNGTMESLEFAGSFEITQSGQAMYALTKTGNYLVVVE
ncbi:MAG: choice-of-anchor I family protein [Lachnospiraceae bacterium]